MEEIESLEQRLRRQVRREIQLRFLTKINHLLPNTQKLVDENLARIKENYGEVPDSVKIPIYLQALDEEKDRIAEEIVLPDCVSCSHAHEKEDGTPYSPKPEEDYCSKHPGRPYKILMGEVFFCENDDRKYVIPEVEDRHIKAKQEVIDEFIAELKQKTFKQE